MLEIGRRCLSKGTLIIDHRVEECLELLCAEDAAAIERLLVFIGGLFSVSKQRD